MLIILTIELVQSKKGRFTKKTGLTIDSMDSFAYSVSIRLAPAFQSFKLEINSRVRMADAANPGKITKARQEKELWRYNQSFPRRKGEQNSWSWGPIQSLRKHGSNIRTSRV